MPGAYCGPRCPHCRAEPGPDCADKARATRTLRHADKAALDRYLTTEYGSVARNPLVDLSDCIHGCNGMCVVSGSDRCTSACHDSETVAFFESRYGPDRHSVA
jgi:hypothetical protein